MKFILLANYISMFITKLFEGKVRSLVLTILFLVIVNTVEAQTTTNRFNDGYLSVFKSTSGSTLLSSGTAVVVEEYAPTGANQSSANFNVALPTTSPNLIVTSGTATAAGQISRAENGRYIIVPGYNAAIGAANSTFTTNGTLRTVNGSGTVGAGVEASSTQWLSGSNNVRGGTSDDGTNFWVTGSGVGIQNVTAPNAPITVSSTSTNNRACYIYNGQLYLTTGAGSQGIYSVGTLKPLTTGNTASRLFVPTDADVYGFSISPDGKTIYYAVATGSSGLYRSTYDGSSWTGTRINNTTGFTGITVDWSDYNFNVSLTNGAKIFLSNQTTVSMIADNGSTAVTATVLRTISGNNVFRGLAFSPIKQTLSLGTNSPAVGNIITNTNNAALFQFSLSADEGNSTLKKLILMQNGTASIGSGNSISNFRLIEDLDNNGIASASEISASLSTGVVESSKVNFSVAINTSNYIQQGNTRNYIILGDISAAGSGTFIPSIATNNTINTVAYTSNLVNAGGSLVTIGTNAPSGNTLTILSSVTWNGTSWSNGTGPTASTDAIISGAYSVAANITAKTLAVNNSAVVTIPSGNNVTVTGVVTVTAPATLTFSNNANLIQVNNTTNTGSITVNRNSSLLKRLDYTLWSSPVTGTQTLAGFSPLTSQSLSQFYTFNTTFNTAGVNGAYAAVATPSTATFAAGAGYLIRMPNTASDTPTAFAGQFVGVPNNGDIAVSLVDGLAAGLRYNLVGNPYPSTIKMQNFVFDNAANIQSTLYFWRKTNGSGTAYSTWVAGPLVTDSGTFTTNGNAQTVDPAGIIQTGQGFFVEAKSLATTVTFKNSQRLGNNTNQFFKTKQLAESNKIWLNATSAAGDFSQMAITYYTNATLGVDDFDGKYINDSKFALTSNINDGEYTIQGRPAFDSSDVVALNFKTNVAGEYKIAIDHVAGVFSADQDIFLVDSKNATETNLKNGSYTFTAVSGVDNTRFSLKFQKTLNVDDAVFNDNTVSVYAKNGTLYVNTGNVSIKSVEVYDVQGKLLAERKNLNASTTSVENLKVSHQVLLVKVTGENNFVVTKKVLN